MAKGKWEGDKFIAKINGKLANNLEKASIHLQASIKDKLNTEQDYQRTTGKGVYYTGLNPSQAGEAPHKLTGHLQRSIAYKMVEKGERAFIGTPLDYGFFLEMGTIKQGPRPFLRATLAEQGPTLSRIITTGRK